MLIGEAVSTAVDPDPTNAASEELVELRCNVDDLDPRVWPSVVESLLTAGALDAWLTPISMKGGRPAVMLEVLARSADTAQIAEVVFTETSTLGLRWHPVIREVLERTWTHVSIEDQTIAVKIGWREGKAITVQPEWRDVLAAAAALGRPARQVLEEARASVTEVT